MLRLLASLPSLASLAALVHTAAAVKLTAETLTFGHAVKNGALPPVNGTHNVSCTFFFG